MREKNALNAFYSTAQVSHAQARRVTPRFI